jgi:predicted CoA-binding protein
MTENNKATVVLGASPKAERYSNKAVRLLTKKGYQVIPVHPLASTIEDLAVVRRLADISGPVHTLTVYVSKEISSALEQDLIQLKPERVIFNPGSENPDLSVELNSHGIPTQEACTLVLLNNGQY